MHFSHCTRRLVSLLCASLLIPAVMATPAATELLPSGARTGLLIQPLSAAQPRLLRQTGDYFPPASTLKVVTALAATLELGPDFRFETELRSSRSGTTLIFSGDPTLSSEDLTQLLTQLRDKQGKDIQGDLWLDNRAFSGYERAVGWPWDITGVCYSAPASAMNLDGNCIQASIYTQTDGATRVFVPKHYPVQVTTEARAVSKVQQKSEHCDLELNAGMDNAYHLSGCLAQRKQPMPLKFAVQNTELYLKRRVYALLNQLGITLHGEIRIGTLPQDDPSQQVAIHRSAPLTELLDKMLKKSDNLIADTVTKTLGRRFFLQPGSFSNGTEAIKQIIFSRTGISLQDAQLVDGSGLSRNNRIRLDTMRQILHYLWQNDAKLGVLAMLPVAGESGTLKYRRSMRSDDIRGHIRAKSGSLYGTYNMMGFALDDKGQPDTLFIQYVTDYFPEERDSDSAEEAPITRFENEFYRELIKREQKTSNAQ